ncbi:MAG: TetR/AcrR family transcriptional regulator [Deltaproteobacteria bacterium]
MIPTHPPSCEVLNDSDMMPAAVTELRKRDATKTRQKLLRAAEYLFIRKGYAATTVDEICKRAGATKGAFFHHFKNKEDLGVACGRDHAQRHMDMLNAAAEQSSDQPVDRLFDYLDHVVTSSTQAELPACLIGMLTLELSAVNERFHEMCNEELDSWVNTVEQLLGDAVATTGRNADVSALAQQFLTTFQGSMMLARAKRDPKVIAKSMNQYRDHVAFAVTGGAGPAPRQSHTEVEARA